ncbi:AMP-binding protein [Streptomyces sp. NPDC004728]|uniref:AMP-binding protein n=1 Tax=Streptomyces sp. NPDC004728 TaxID=3154289 RepID=UPI0033B4A947
MRNPPSTGYRAQSPRCTRAADDDRCGWIFHRSAACAPRLLTTAGQPFPDTQVRILDDEGTPVAAGRCGEICVRTPTLMSGYWHNPVLTSQVLRDGWLHTGDLGSLDTDGYLTVTGRQSTMAIVDAHNVHPPASNCRCSRTHRYGQR